MEKGTVEEVQVSLIRREGEVREELVTWVRKEKAVEGKSYEVHLVVEGEPVKKTYTIEQVYGAVIRRTEKVPGASVRVVYVTKFGG